MDPSLAHGLAAVIEFNFNLAQLFVIVVIISKLLNVSHANSFLSVIIWLVNQLTCPIRKLWPSRPKTQIDISLFILLGILVPSQMFLVSYLRGAL